MVAIGLCSGCEIVWFCALVPNAVWVIVYVYLLLGFVCDMVADEFMIGC